MVALPGVVAAADPSASPDQSTEAGASPEPTPTPDPTPSPDPTPFGDPAPTAEPTPSADSTPSPEPTPAPEPTEPPVAPASFNLFISSGFRYQDPNYAACTATSVRSMLNFVSLRGTGGPDFVWHRTNAGSVRDSILSWERRHDTMTGGHGSDPHGWRNALNYYGWGPTTLVAGARVYDDFAFTSFDTAMKAAVRALVATGKPVGLLGWRGAHAQMITGYYGLSGDPFARDAAGRYTNAFSVAGFYLTDPLRSSKTVNRARSYSSLRLTTTYRLRFQRFYETDSRLDDIYTPGFRLAKSEWYKRFVLVLPVR